MRNHSVTEILGSGTPELDRNEAHRPSCKYSNRCEGSGRGGTRTTKVRSSHTILVCWCHGKKRDTWIRVSYCFTSAGNRRVFGPALAIWATTFGLAFCSARVSWPCAVTKRTVALRRILSGRNRTRSSVPMHVLCQRNGSSSVAGFGNTARSGAQSGRRSVSDLSRGRGGE
jgi:hypothetical protein